jgi:hypothetical protein
MYVAGSWWLLVAKDEKPLNFVPMNVAAGIPLTHQPKEHFVKNC